MAKIHRSRSLIDRCLRKQSIHHSHSPINCRDPSITPKTFISVWGFGLWLMRHSRLSHCECDCDCECDMICLVSPWLVWEIARDWRTGDRGSGLGQCPRGTAPQRNSAPIRIWVRIRGWKKWGVASSGALSPERLGFGLKLTQSQRITVADPGSAPATNARSRRGETLRNVWGHSRVRH